MIRPILRPCRRRRAGGVAGVWAIMRAGGRASGRAGGRRKFTLNEGMPALRRKDGTRSEAGRRGSSRQTGSATCGPHFVGRCMCSQAIGTPWIGAAPGTPRPARKARCATGSLGAQAAARPSQRMRWSRGIVASIRRSWPGRRRFVGLEAARAYLASVAAAGTEWASIVHLPEIWPGCLKSTA